MWGLFWCFCGWIYLVLCCVVVVWYVGGMSPEDAGLLFCDRSFHADRVLFGEVSAFLRAEAPVVRVEHPDFDPFFLVTGFRGVSEVLGNSSVWVVGEGFNLLSREDRVRSVEFPRRTLLHLDGVEHSVFRRVGVDWFSSGFGGLGGVVSGLVDDSLDGLVGLGGVCDFVGDVAVGFSVRVLLSVLGLPDSDFGRVSGFLREFFLFYNSCGDFDDFKVALDDFVRFFWGLVDDFRVCPVGGLASAVSNGCFVGGEFFGKADVLSYLGFLCSAGSDSVAACLSGGLLGFLRFPGEWDRLVADRGLLGSAVEEVVRWVSPERQVLRTAVSDCVVDGVLLRAGDSVLLSTASANRDGSVFVDADCFDVGRFVGGGRHLGFGFGPHFCMGARLARLELSLFFDALLSRVGWFELDGEPEFFETLYMGGLRSLPVRFGLV